MTEPGRPCAGLPASASAKSSPVTTATSLHDIPALLAPKWATSAAVLVAVHSDVHGNVDDRAHCRDATQVGKHRENDSDANGVHDGGAGPGMPRLECGTGSIWISIVRIRGTAMRFPVCPTNPSTLDRRCCTPRDRCLARGQAGCPSRCPAYRCCRRTAFGSPPPHSDQRPVYLISQARVTLP